MLAHATDARCSRVCEAAITAIMAAIYKFGVLESFAVEGCFLVYGGVAVRIFGELCGEACADGERQVYIWEDEETLSLLLGECYALRWVYVYHHLEYGSKFEKERAGVGP